MTKTRIAILRKQRGWTQEKLAEESQVNTRTVQRLESGEDASLETLRLIANALDVQIADLFESLDDSDKSKEIINLDSRKAKQTQQWLTIRSFYRLGMYTVFIVLMFTLLSAVSLLNDDSWIGLIGIIFWIILWPLGVSVIKIIQVSWIEPYLSRKYPMAENPKLVYKRQDSNNLEIQKKSHSWLWILGILLLVIGIGCVLAFLPLLKIIL
ncbi:helix-turn-helix domain-containing protein [Lentilactobacillus hilgardii]|uniref:helix-turn-helix domain-containing protein n=1 Tax=Lentilactobacillus hilgardii TaxID=1588 RepID=UPI003FA5F2D9